MIPTGPDVDRHLKSLRKYIEGGVTQLALAHPGEDSEGYFRVWKNELRPILAGPDH